MPTKTRRVNGGLAPRTSPVSTRSLHTTRALDSRCGENDGSGALDSRGGENDGGRGSGFPQRRERREWGPTPTAGTGGPRASSSPTPTVPCPRHSRRSGNPEPRQCANTVKPTKTRRERRPGPCPPFPNRTQPPVILAAAGIQSPQPPSFSPQRESRALTLRQHGHANEDAPGTGAGPLPSIPQPYPAPRHSRRSGNPEPRQCANTVKPTRTRRELGPGPCPPFPNRTLPPSFSPQRESRAQTLRQHGNGNEDAPGTGAGPLPSIPQPYPAPSFSPQRNPEPPASVILAAAGIQSPDTAPTRSSQRRRAGNWGRAPALHSPTVPRPRHSRRSGNPEPPASVILAAAGIQSPQPPSFSPQRESRALTLRQHGQANEDAPGTEPGPCPPFPNRTLPPSFSPQPGIQSPDNAPTRSCQRRRGG